jgi:acyl-CoA synthetase (NDP forming)
MGGVTLGHALLSPRSIALIGVSDDPAKTSARPLIFLRRAGYAGRVYPINPKRDQVLGERSWRSMDSLPEPPDHAFIVTPTDAVADAVAQCGEAGVKVATILASGFSEAGKEGKGRERRLADVAARSGIRIVGPSSLGVINLREKMILTANAAFAEPDLPVGGIFCVSHSGSLIGGLMSRGKARGIGFAGLVSVGNETDLGIGEICAATLDDPGIDSYVLFLENLRKADALRDFALQAAERGRPVLAYKLGRSEAARELAVSHTGALAGDDAVANAFLKECGIARVSSFDALVEAPSAALRIAPATRSGGAAKVGVVTTTGGGAAMVVDQLGLRGIAVEAPAPETWERLEAAGVRSERGRIVDLTMAGTRYPVMKAALDTLLAAPEFDLVVAVVGSSARFQPELAVAPIIDCSMNAARLAAFIVPDAPDALRRLSEAGVPSFRSPEVCADALAAALTRPSPRRIPDRPRSAVSPPDAPLTELEAYALLEGAGIPCAPAVAVDLDIAKAPELPFSYPVAMKILSSEIAHKTDVGGVKLGIPEAAAFMRELRSLKERVAQSLPNIVLQKVLVQPMLAGVGEVLLGYKLDADVGPLVLLAPGGVLAELAGERALRLAPVDLDTARQMIAELKSLRALAGFRNRPKGDLDALARAIVNFSNLAMWRSNIGEAEINPLIVRPEGQGVVAVDALVRPS